MNNTKTKSRLCHLLSFCIALTLFQACEVDDLVGLNYDRIAHLGSFFGDPNHSMVIIHAQGGPSIKLEDQELIDLIKPINTNGIIVANIKQFQVLEPRLVNTIALSGEQANTYSTNSVDSLVTVIRHFKNQNKTVYVLGSGYGGYLVQESIARYGSDEADNYLIMGSRLNIQSEFNTSWAIGNNAQYDYGATPAGVISSSTNTLTDQNLNKLLHSLAQNNYTVRLQNEALNNVTYVFLDQDERVGPVNMEEQSFLASKGANMIIGSGDHKNGIREFIETGVRQSFGID